jgi:uncharacterized ubiquitin-like protein YukD
MLIHARSVGEIAAFRVVSRDEAVDIFRKISGRKYTVEISDSATGAELVEKCFELFEISHDVILSEKKLYQGDDLLMQHGSLKDLGLKDGDCVEINLVVEIR